MCRRASSHAVQSRRRRALFAALAVIASLVTPLTFASDASATGATGETVTVGAARVLDSRTGLGVRKAALGSGATVTALIAGRGGVPGSGAAAAVLSITAYPGTRGGSLTVWPYGSARPAAATLSYQPGQAIALATDVKLGAGRVSVYNSGGPVNVALDVQAWQTAGTTTTAGTRLVALSPTRVVDTRSGLGAPRAKVGPARTLNLVLGGKGGLPASGAAAYALHLTGMNATAKTALTVWRYGSARPAMPNVYVNPGIAGAAAVVVPPGVGRVSVYNAAGSVDVAVDTAGYYAPPSTTAKARIVPQLAAHVLDTRTGVGAPIATLTGGHVLNLQVAGRGGSPSGGVTAAALLLTGVRPTATTYLTVWPYGTARPATPNLYIPRGAVVSTGVLAKLGAGGKVSIFASSGALHVLADLTGWYESPPVPVTKVAPTPTNIADAAKALYTGTAPVQTGVAANAIDLTHVAIVRGTIVKRDGSALSGATVKVLDHPEWGLTHTLVDGSFQMAVNGGAQITVQTSATGYLTAQRDQQVNWLEYATVPQTILVALDTTATSVPLTGASSGVTVARGSVITDSNGTRQSTLLFAPGTTATMELPNGTTQPVTAGTVRATEFTVGTDGQAAMPGELPSNSGYTYATEFSLDQAQTAGATRVDFSKPVYTYTDNFLGFPAGTPVPAGYYDRGTGQWVGAPDGRVIDIVSITSGAADIDVTGDGVADTGTALTALGFTDAERQKLATLYPTAPKSLWRVGVTHFTPWDYNWPYGPPPDATDPNAPDPQDPNGPDQRCQQGGSIISCETQTLGESIGINGTPYALRYSSERVPGYRAASTIKVPLSGSTVPGSLTSIKLSVDVAGQHFEQGFGGSANQQATFGWNGLNAYSQPVQGSQTAHVSIGFGYHPVYYSTASSGDSVSAFVASFARFGGAPITRGGDPITGSQLIYISKKVDVNLGGYDARGEGLAGWSLDVHHVYDPAHRVLYMGDGSRRSSEGMRPTISTLAGDGVQGYGGDGGSAADAELSNARGVAVDRDGAVYVADTGNAVIRKISKSGVITTVAGGGSPADGYGDGGPATSAQLVGPSDVAVSPTGQLLIADTGNNRVRLVSSDGTISTVAGAGDPVDGIGDGADATASALLAPRGVSFGPDGTLYVADTGNNRVRAINPDGSIYTVAGGGTPVDGLGDGLAGTSAALNGPTDVAVLDKSVLITDTGNNRVRKVSVAGVISTFAGTGVSAAAVDGKPADASPLARPEGIDVGSDGTVYLADRGHHRIREIHSDGILTTTAGSGVGGSAGDAGAPLAAQLSFPTGIAASPDGGVVIADAGNFRVRAVRPALPGLGSSTIVIVSEDGTELYQFSSTGRHLVTRDALTGTTIYTFGYDASGRLTTVADRDGNTTTIERDSGGNPTAIVAPFGQRTGLIVGSNGYLGSVVDPAGSTVSFGYGTDGLLTSMTDPRGGKHLMTYDGIGRLIKDAEPGGPSKTLSRSDNDTGYVIHVTTALGRTATYTSQQLSDGRVKRTQVAPNGATQTSVRQLDGSIVVTTPEGLTRTSTVTPDPRWGQQAPYVAKVVITGAGRSTTSTTTRSAVLSNAADPMSVVTYTVTKTVDGKTTTSTYTASSRTTNTTSPEGRADAVTTDSKGHVVGSRTGTLAPWTYAYDAFGRLTTVTQGSGAEARVTSTTYNGAGLPAQVTDALGRKTSFTYDADGRTLTTTRPDGGVVGSTYDASGNVTKVTPPGRTAHAFTYTADDRASTYAPPAAVPTVTQNNYNGDDQISSVSRPGGQTISYDYDASGQLTTVGDGSVSHVFTYDSAGRLSGFSSPSDGSATTIAYESGLPTVVNVTGLAPGSLSYGYDGHFLMSSRSVAGGPTAALTRDQDELLTGFGGLSVSRDANGQVTGQALGSTTTAFTYDAFGQVTRRVDSVSGSAVLDVTTTYDALGRIATRAEVLGGVTTTLAYGYDTVGRLTSVSKNGTLVATYGYDANGNRTSRVVGGTTTTATYDSQDRLLTRGTAQYGYTAHGDTQTITDSGKTTTLAYDGFGNLRSVATTGKPTVTYVADGRNRRTGVKVAGTLVQGFLYEHAGNQPVAELDGNGAVVSRFYGGDSGAPAFIEKAGVTYRVISDERGSARLVIDASTGAVAQKLSYDEWGNVTEDTNPGFQPFGFAGGLYDFRTGLVRFGARDYDPASGRWLTKDPLGLAAGTNVYRYAGSEPINGVDPTGLACCGLPSLQDFVDASAGIGDGISSVLCLGQCSPTRWLRHELGQGDTVNECSDNYDLGKKAGPFLWAAPIALEAAPVAAAEEGPLLEAEAADAAESCGFNSFTADTPVLMADGTRRRIAEVHRGDLIRAADPETGETRAEPVTDVIVHGGLHRLVDLTLSDGSVLRATDGHPLWVATTHRFTDAIDVHRGDHLLLVSGVEMRVVDVFVEEAAPLVAYNLTVQGIHTFFAGATPALVHNSCTYHPRIRARGVEDPPAHNFPYSFDETILESTPTVQADGSLLYRVPGGRGFNGTEGYYEIAVNPDTNVIFHRTFVSG